VRRTPPDGNPAHRPLSEAETEALLAPIAGAPGVAVAVSGGSDSLALLAAVDGWRKAPGRPRVVVLTVDHGLSPGSDAAAKRVAAIAAARGLDARLLTWSGPKPRSNIEAAARLARYRLLAAAARAAGATHLLTAHSLDDQAETFLMRIERGAGVFGLAAMRRMIELDGLVLFRPFLAVPRSRLAATTAKAGLAAFEDPMNADPRFLRVRVRRALPALAEAGIGPELLAAAAARLGEAADAIDAAVDRLVADAVRIDDFAVARLDAQVLATTPAAVMARLTTRLLAAIGGEPYPPRHERLGALLAALSRPSPRLKRTLAGVVVERRPAAVLFYRELGRGGLASLAAAPGFCGAWDHRFEIGIPPDAPEGLTVAALGRQRPPGYVRPPGVPAGAIAALPAIFAGGRLLAVPALGHDGGAPGPRFTVREIVGRRLAKPPRFPDLPG
jgi:tRNA(Ile)-lysidine synthase